MRARTSYYASNVRRQLLVSGGILTIELGLATLLLLGSRP